MIESQINQIAAVIPTTNPSIPSQPEGLEYANLVDIFDAGAYWATPQEGGMMNLCQSRKEIPNARSS